MLFSRLFCFFLLGFAVFWLARLQATSAKVGARFCTLDITASI
jgi:hypothetical protein